MTLLIGEEVYYKYCTGHEEFHGCYRRISRALYPPTMLPSVQINPPSMENLLPMYGKVLQFIHEQTVRHDRGITYYNEGKDISVENAIHALLPDEVDMHSARNQIFLAMQYLKDYGFVRGVIATGKFRLWLTLRGAGCLKRISS